MLKFGRSEPEFLGFSGDLSHTGIFIKTNNVFRPGTHLAIDLVLPDESNLRLYGYVMWAKKVPASLIRQIKKGGMGVQLENISDEYINFVKTLN